MINLIKKTDSFFESFVVKNIWKMKNKSKISWIFYDEIRSHAIDLDESRTKMLAPVLEKRQGRKECLNIFFFRSLVHVYMWIWIWVRTRQDTHTHTHTHRYEWIMCHTPFKETNRGRNNEPTRNDVSINRRTMSPLVILMTFDTHATCRWTFLIIIIRFDVPLVIKSIINTFISNWNDQFIEKRKEKHVSHYLRVSRLTKRSNGRRENEENALTFVLTRLIKSKFHQSYSLIRFQFNKSIFFSSTLTIVKCIRSFFRYSIWQYVTVFIRSNHLIISSLVNLSLTNPWLFILNYLFLCLWGQEDRSKDKRIIEKDKQSSEDRCKEEMNHVHAIRWKIVSNLIIISFSYWKSHLLVLQRNFYNIVIRICFIFMAGY